MTKTRRREHRIVIRASAETVWRALVEAEQIVRWYAPDAEVEPGLGGRYWVSWGEGMSGASRIEIFEPRKHLRLVQLPQAGGPELETPVTEDYYLDKDGELTVLRLVQSGIPASSAWDDFYEDTNRGWQMFLAGLRHYLERHLGVPRKNISFMQPIRIPLEEAWRKLVGPEGLAAKGSLDGMKVGEKRTVTTAFGQELRAQVVVHLPPHTLSLTIDNLEDSLLALDFERMGESTYLYANLSTFGIEDRLVEPLARQWKAWIDRLFPAPSGATA